MSITQSLIKYYINFLETDFKQERSPKRKFTGKESFLDIGSRCGEIAQLIFSKLSQTYTDEEDIVFEIAKGKYFVKSDSSKIEKILNSIKDFFDIQGNIIKGYLVKQELDKKLKLNQETIQKISGFVHKSEFIDFFRDTEYLEVLQNIEKTHFTDSGEILLGNIRGDEEGNKEYIDQENKNHPLINYLFKELSDTITEEDRNILSSLSTYQEVEDFLKSIKSKDIFYILQDIDKDRKSNEKFEIFFNFFEIKISNNITNRSESFPLFFIQCDLEYANSCFTIKLSKTINFNRKLVRYLTQKIEGGIDWSLSPSEGIFAQSKNFINDVNTKISDLLNKIQISQKITLENNNVFELKKLTVEKNIATYQELRQIYQQHSLEISNNCCFCVDEKEFVLIDPETLPDNDRNIIYGFIENTIDNILSGNPKNHNKEIQHKVDRMSVEDKLSYISPIPLNEQQIQILTALETEGCNNIIVEGPPGTGKSHSIVAILQHCIKNNKKVLFVSDKKEALDVVEEKINNVFDNGNLKAPIIRIGGSSGEKNFGKLLSTSYIESLETYKQKNHPPSEEQLDSHKKGIQEKIQTEINLVKKIIDNLGNIQYYLEHEEMCENILNNFFVETDRNKQDIVTLLKYIHGLSSVNNTLLRDFNIFEIHTTCIEAEKKVFETIISCIEQIKNTIEAATPETLELMVQNFNQDVSFAQIKKNYKKRFGKDLQTFINNYFDNFDNEELDTFEQIEVFCKKVDFIRQSLENITIHNIKNISLKDIKSKDKIKEISNLVEEYHKIYTQFFGITKIFKKTKLETIAQNIKQLCGNSNFDVVDFEKVKNIKENDLVELQKIYCLDDKPDFDFTSYIKKLNTIKEQKIDLSLFEDTEQYFNLTSFESFGINNLDGYILLDDVFGIITTIKKIFGNIQRLKNRTFGLLNINLENIIEKIVPSNITILSNYEYIETIGTIRNECETMINTLENLNRFLGAFDIEDIQAKCLDFKLSLKKNKININSIKTFHNKISYSIDDLEILERYLKIKSEIAELIKFYKAYPSYFDKKRELEKKSATHLFGNLAERLIDYYRNNRNDLGTLRKLFGGRMQITDQESQHRLLNILQQFLITVGVVIINIRDIFQYLPLQKDLFDVIIIDEASQVSIGQAFMLLPLAKKVVVLGDKKQFPNIIAMNSDKSIDNYYFQDVLIGRNDLEKSRLEVFRVRNSILDYMQRMCNFEIMLKYHFRGYADLISYSNQMFYNNILIAPKIRAKNIQDTIKFDFLQPDGNINGFGEQAGLVEVTNNINTTEANFIFEKLQEFKKNNFQGTIGILTPFKNQQRHIQSMIYVSKLKERFEKDCKGIIATFDTCQGQEKDYIFYSMVSNGGGNAGGSGNLNTIFPVNIGDHTDDQVKLKEARLNVGFSRAKETVHFVLSTQLDQIGGAIGDALRHFYAKLTNPIENQVDQNSEREKKLVKWIKSTNFYKKHHKNISIVPQFPIGEYLNQINNANIPHYRVDFLCTIKKGDKQKIFIIEYDGFEYHFKNRERVNENNFENYQIEKDIERQKIIEYYGYQFLRYNKFILSNNPIKKINNDLYALYNGL